MSCYDEQFLQAGNPHLAHDGDDDDMTAEDLLEYPLEVMQILDLLLTEDRKDDWRMPSLVPELDGEFDPDASAGALLVSALGTGCRWAEKSRAQLALRIWSRAEKWVEDRAEAALDALR